VENQWGLYRLTASTASLVQLRTQNYRHNSQCKITFGLHFCTLFILSSFHLRTFPRLNIWIENKSW